MKYSGYFSSIDLRLCLWSYLRIEILSLQLNCGSQEDREKGLYNVALLRLLKGLIMKGFFDETDQFLLAYRAEEDEEEEEENDEDNASEINNRTGCLKWMMKDRKTASGTYAPIKIIFFLFFTFVFCFN